VAKANPFAKKPKGGAKKPNPFAKGKETAKEEKMEGKFKPFSKGGKT